MDLTYKIVRRLFRDKDVSFSRNQNFAAYDDPVVRKAVRIYKHLRSVEEELLSEDNDDMTVESIEKNGEEIVIKLSFENGRRESFLNTIEWKLLVENRSVKDRLLREFTELERAIFE